ncbi:MAG: VWA domain-containing protein [Alphaproteobacteria bacterium]|nr:VWA domain-containing protein [Alphaproteobacteria bacterium]
MNALLLLALAGCAIESGIHQLSRVDTFTQEPSSEVDILWVVDDSQSMADEQAQVAQGFDLFIRALEDSYVDFQLGVVTTDMDVDNPERGHLVGDPLWLTPEDDVLTLFPERVQVGIEGSHKEKGLAAAVEALTPPIGDGLHAGFVRPDATLAIIFVSDEEDCSDDFALEGLDADACYTEKEKLVAVETMVGQLEQLKENTDGRVITSAIVGQSWENDCSDNVAPGRRYLRAAEITGGVVGDICEADYSSLMEELGLAVSGVLSAFRLECDADPSSIVVTVDEDIVEADPNEGWTYDAENRMLRFDGVYVPPRGSTISVEYTVSGTCGELVVDETTAG